MSKRTKTCSNLQTSFVRWKKHILITILESKFKFYMDTSSLNGKKRRVTAKVCYILFLIVIFVCMENDFQYLRSSPEWEQSSTEFFRTIHFKMKRESFQQLLIIMDCLFFRVLCGVWSLPVLVPLYLSVLICHVKILQNAWSEFQRSDWSTNYPNSQSERHSYTSSSDPFCQCNLFEREHAWIPQAPGSNRRSGLLRKV